ncbi:MAG: hypothetical protein K0R38_2158 [Polyangiaceae bacterium]|jgi:hypothetical protein|nr:hypothetical protein [Polyangiaceae bacterium]
MIFLPASCDRCGEVGLIPGPECVDGRATCETCGGLAFALVGPAVPESDVLLFNELCWAIEQSSLAAADAAQLALALSDATTPGEGMELLDLAVTWFPSLSPLRPALAANLTRTRHAFSMVGLILAERSASRSAKRRIQGAPFAAER